MIPGLQALKISRATEVSENPGKSSYASTHVVNDIDYWQAPGIEPNR